MCAPLVPRDLTAPARMHRSSLHARSGSSSPLAKFPHRQAASAGLSSASAAGLSRVDLEMDARLAQTNSMKNLKVSMESERIFSDLDDELAPASPVSRELRSRLSTRTSLPSGSASSPSNGGSRVSVKDQIYALECKVQSHEDTIQKVMSIHQADKALLLSKIEEITDRMGEELHKLRLDYQKKLTTASEEIERLNKCLNVQRGHITTLQEQCQSLHKHVVQVDDDVTKLATEVLGE